MFVLHLEEGDVDEGGVEVDELKWKMLPSLPTLLSWPTLSLTCQHPHESGFCE